MHIGRQHIYRDAVRLPLFPSDCSTEVAKRCGKRGEGNNGWVTLGLEGAIESKDVSITIIRAQFTEPRADFNEHDALHFHRRPRLARTVVLWSAGYIFSSWWEVNGYVSRLTL